MAQKHQKILELSKKICRMGKISNNLETHGGEYVTAFTFPITGCMLTESELNAFMDDKYTAASWYETRSGVKYPMRWWGEEEFSITPAYEADSLEIKVSGDREIKFEREDAKDEDDDETGRAACKISNIRLKPVQGGFTEMKFSLTVLPGISRVNLMLQEHQHREVKLSLGNGQAVAKKTKQDELPLGEGGAAANGETVAEPPASTSANAEAKEFEEGVKGQIAAHKAKRKGASASRKH